MLGQIAGLIAAVGFVALVGFLAVPILKLGKMFDTTTASIKNLADHTVPILDESALAVASANGQLVKVDTITTAASEVSQNVSALTGLYAATFGAPLVKVAAFSYGVRQAFASAAARFGGSGPKDSGTAQPGATR